MSESTTETTIFFAHRWGPPGEVRCAVCHGSEATGIELRCTCCGRPMCRDCAIGAAATTHREARCARCAPLPPQRS